MADTKEVFCLKRLLPVLLALVICVSSTLCVSASGGFGDVAPGAWYADAVDYVVGKGYFNGVSDTQFMPDSGMTRGMFITVLGRMASVPDEMSRAGVIIKSAVNLRKEPNTASRVLATLPKDTDVNVLGLEDGWYRVRCAGEEGYIRSDLMEQLPDKFRDVPDDRYYAPYVQWAVQKGMVSGTTETTFSPDAPITREQLCAILYNFSVIYEVDLGEIAETALFADDGDIGVWASRAVYTFRGIGVINGRDEKTFAPLAGATRAEVAVILRRYVSAIGENNLPNVRVRFGMPVPESAAVTNSYFDDACFIGHSMAVGMSDYFRLNNADFYAVNGVSAAGLLENAYFALPEKDSAGKTRYGTVCDVLREKEDAYGKVYILLGTNELGPQSYHLEKYAASMETLIDTVRETQPNAKIYLMSTFPVSAERSAKDRNFNRENVLAFNERLLSLSLEKKVYYLDTYGLFADEDGYMPAGMCASDGIHILAAQYAALLTYLKTHVV